MKRVFGICLLCLTLILIGGIAYQINLRSDLEFEFGREFFGGSFPVRDIVIVHENVGSRENPSNNTLLLLFNPDCNACFKKITDLSKNSYRLNEYNVVMVATVDTSIISEYMHNFDLSGFSSLKVGRINSPSLENYIIPYPSVIVYDKAGNFLKGFRGSVEITKLISENN